MRANCCVASARVAAIGSAITVTSTLPGPLALARPKGRRDFPPRRCAQGFFGDASEDYRDGKGDLGPPGPPPFFSMAIFVVAYQAQSKQHARERTTLKQGINH